MQVLRYRGARWPPKCARNWKVGEDAAAALAPRQRDLMRRWGDLMAAVTKHQDDEQAERRKQAGVAEATQGAAPLGGTRVYSILTH